MRKKSILIKFTAILVSSVIIFSGCQNSRYDRFGETETESTTTGSSGSEDETTGHHGNTPNSGTSEDNKKIQEEFDQFLLDTYIDSMSSSLVSAHFDLEHPEDYGITEYDSIWGDDFLESYEKALEEDKELYNELTAFNYDALTEDQQLTYDTLEKFLENCFDLDEFYYFGEAFSPTSGSQFELNLILSEFRINDKDDLTNYIETLSTCDDYINNLLEYEKWRADNGYAMTDSAIDDVIGQCQDILAASEPAFLPVIREVIDGCDFLSDDEKSTYKTQITTLATENFIPAYENIISTLTAIKGSRSVEGGLCNYENGKEYYESLIRLYTGSEKSMEELIDAIEQDIYSGLLKYSSIAMSDPDIETKLNDELVYAKTEPDEILAYLIYMLESDFPAPVYTGYTLKYVAESMESSSNPAFYLVPPSDNYKHNIIYVNNSDEYAHMDLFPLLAHEGMPGHMYQINYFLSLNPNPVRSLLSFDGYAEGWAQYVEHYSYNWSGIDENVADIMVIDDKFSFALYSRIDIGVNYEGWDVKDIENYLKDYLTDTSISGELYELFINDPGIYLQYYIGELEILELKEKAMDELGNDFDIKEFHQFFLEVGPTYFDIIEDRMEDWIEEY
ncbi:MAG: DUF885 domain-containing protein [Lachnospiraceae bacterium]|nr:DUF885 domain-containing protein [Lachnospiraceae bacterium]